MLKWAREERMLSDFLYATVEAEWSDKALEGHETDAEMRKAIYRENAKRLFPWFAGK